MCFVGLIWLYIGMAYYNVHSHRILSKNKKLGNDIHFTSEPRTARVIGIYLLGGFIISLLAPIIAGLLAGILGFISNLVLSGVEFGAGDIPIGFFVGSILGYVAAFVVIGILVLIFITQPILKHFAEVTTVHNAENLVYVEQRKGDEMIEAEGFADALDVGAGF
jgi:MFS family permease